MKTIETINEIKMTIFEKINKILAKGKRHNLIFRMKEVLSL